MNSKDYDENERDEKEHKEYIESINHITSFLNTYEKEYTLQYWGSGEGVSFIIKQEEGDFKIELNDTGYLSFDFEKKERKHCSNCYEFSLGCEECGRMNNE